MHSGRTLLYPTILVLMLLSNISMAQQFGPGSNWYFGQNAGITFTTNPPTATIGSLVTQEGCSTISDANGNLLFSTDGGTVYTKTHTVMANGTGLGGNFSTAQSGVIVQSPANTNIYYIFSLGAGNVGNLYWSRVDMTLAGGFGSVTVLASQLQAGCLEKLTAVKHANGTDYWIVVHDGTASSTNTLFRAYLLTASGVSTTPVTSTVGTGASTQSIGYLKFSPDGLKLASAFYGGAGVELYDFNRSTGQISNAITLTTPTSNNYAVEFSPDGTKLYSSSSSGNICQWSICAGTASAIAASLYTMAATNNWALQLAPNGKIYVTRYQQAVLGVIHNPNLAGASCNYVDQSFTLASGSLGRLGLPNYVTTWFLPPAPQFTTIIGTQTNGIGCMSASVTAPPTSSLGLPGCSALSVSLASMHWNFGDPNSGSANTSTLTSLIHQFSNLGTYTISLVLNYTNNQVDTLKQVVNITQPCISVSSTSITCATLGSATVSAIGGLGPFSYTWMPSAQTSSVATGLSPGVYTITVHDQGNNYTYTATTLFTSLVPLTGVFASQLNLPCFGAATGTAQYTNIQGGSTSQYFTWSNGNTSFSTTSAYVNTLTAGLWTATVIDALTGCSQQDLFMVIQPFNQVVSIAVSSPTACVGAPISFTASSSGGTGSSYSFSWTPGPAGATRSVTQNVAGTYVYTVLSTDANTCTVPGTVSVQFIPLPTITVASASICPLETGTITAYGASTYTWSSNSTGATFADSPTVASSYSVIGTALACTAAATGSIYIKPLPTPVLTSNAPICNGQALVLSGSGGTAYAWSGVGSYSASGATVTIAAATPTRSGVYTVTVTAANSCTASTQQSLTVYPTPTVTAAGTTVCSNGTLLLSANSVSNAVYQWNGPSGFSSLQQNPSITVPSASITGNYTVTVFGTNNCSNTAVAQASVTPFITPTITSNAPLCQLNTLNLSVTGGATFQWLGPGGYFNSGTLISIPSIALSSAGVYSVTATNGPCTATQTHTVVVHPLPTPTAAVNAPVCETKSLVLSGASTNTIVTWAWFYPSGGAKSGQYIGRDSSTTSFSGTYTLQVTDNHQCANTTTVAVTILQNPVVKTTNATVCLNEPAILTASGAATYFWKGPGLATANQPAAFIANATSSAPVVYTVTGTAANSCTHITTATLSTWPLPTPFIITSPTNSLCLNSSVALQAGGAVGYEWVGPNAFKEKGPALTIHLNHLGYNGVYTVTGSDANGCRGYATSTITVWPLPYGALVTPKREACLPFCPVVTFTPFTTSSITTMQWNFAGTSFSTTSFSKCLPDEGTYTVSGTIHDINGCSTSASLSLTAYRKPVANFSMSPTTPVESADEVTLTAIGSEKLNYAWIINDQKTVRTQQTAYLFDQAGTYPITLLVSNAIGCADTITKTIYVNQEFNVFIPNAFTPNGDHINDTFLPVTRGVMLYDLMIFDRYGHLVFKTDNPLQGWDGLYNGQSAKQDTYTYKLLITSNSQIQKQFIGEVLLYR